MPESPISTTATIRERRGPAVFVASLPNQKAVVCHLPKNAAHLSPLLVPGTRVIVELTPFDFDHARIAALGPPP